VKNSYRSSPEPLHVALGLLLRSPADLVCGLGADLVIEQVLEREPGAGDIKENLIEAWALVGFVDRPVETRVTISTEVFGEYCADQFARRNSSFLRGLLDPFQQLRRYADGVWNLRHRTALHFFKA
jgi:hypothetical protein